MDREAFSHCDPPQALYLFLSQEQEQKQKKQEQEQKNKAAALPDTKKHMYHRINICILFLNFTMFWISLKSA